jgi:hypothetical protein
VAAIRAKFSSTTDDAGMSVILAMLRIYREGGLRALWSGTTPSLLLVCNPVIQFFLYDALKKQAKLLRPGRGISSSEAFVFGAVSKGVATVVSYPLQASDPAIDPSPRVVSGHQGMGSAGRVLGGVVLGGANLCFDVFVPVVAVRWQVAQSRLRSQEKELQEVGGRDDTHRWAT